MERNNLVLFKPTASFCFGEKVLSSGTRILCPSMSGGGEGCFYHLGGLLVSVGHSNFHRIGKGKLYLECSSM